MPADETYDVVHPLTKKADGSHPGCWNKPRSREPYLVKDGFKLTFAGRGIYESVQMWKLIPSVNSLECHSDDPQCVGCDHWSK